MKRFVPVFFLFLLVACTAETAVESMTAPTETAVSPTAAVEMVMVEPTAVTSTSLPVPTETPVPPEPTQLPPAEPVPMAAVDVVVEYGRTQEGAFYRGVANAPVTLIDYSDFL
ncbi:MAG: hypothetical protein H6667_19310 [Ardenticatenaceae bacterium]|nr:hypothetical protein [Ardenticatenaceae bacterium]MCB9446135.1 hypothetical protein [Ardenticatenaceae bacterium]